MSKCRTTFRGWPPRSRASPAAASGCLRSTAASCSAAPPPDAVTLDKAVMIARQFGPDPINTVQVMQPQQIMLEVRFIEVNRQASRELGFQWNMFGSKTIANIGDQQPASQLPITAAGLQQSAQAQTISPVVAAGVLSGTAPFGFLVSQLAGTTRSMSRSTRWSKRVSRAAWPSRIWWRCRATPRASSPAASFRCRCPARSAKSRSTISPTASASPSRRPC